MTEKFLNIMTEWTEKHTQQFTYVPLPTDCFETPIHYGLQLHCLATKSTLSNGPMLCKP